MNPMPMAKTQVYMPADELRALHALARQKRRRVGDLVREAVRQVWLKSAPNGPVAITSERLRRTSAEHDSAFDEI